MDQVKDFMAVDPVCCLANTKLRVVAKLMLQYNCVEIPVVYSIDQPKIVGVITDRDIVCRTIAHGLNPLEMMADEAMTVPAIVFKMDMSIDDCRTIMEDEQIQRVPVVDEEENCCGMVSLADIVRKSEAQDMSSMVSDISGRIIIIEQ